MKTSTAFALICTHFSGRVRECVEPTTVRGIPFEIGDCFQPAVYAVHHDPEHWGPEPVDEFVPER